MRVLPLCVASLLLLSTACTSEVDDPPANDDGSGGQAGGDNGGGGTGGSAPSDSTTEAVVIDLGELPGGEPVTFEIPEGALGFHVVARSSSTTWGIEEIVDPDGSWVHDNYTPMGGTVGMSYGYGGFATASVPANEHPDALPPGPGTWQLSATGAAPRGKIYVQHTDDGLFHGGVLDLHVHIADGLLIHDPTPAHSITAADAAEDSAVALRLDHFFAALNDHFGIDRGTVSFHPIGSEHLNVVGEAAYAALVEQTAAAPSGQALHVVWANHIEPVAGYPVWGVSPGAPGNVLETGTSTSAIALAVSTDFNALGDGLTMLHELGHFIGLAHTTELQGGLADPIADTPVCENINPNDLGVCPDKTDIMFPAYFGTTGGVGVTVTPTQIGILRGAPLYRAYATERMEQRSHVAPPVQRQPVDTTAVAVPCAHSLPAILRAR